MNHNFLSALLLLFAALDFFGARLAVAGEATQRAATTRINPKDGAEMVLVPAGPFKMGADPMPMDIEKRKQVNTPKHEVTLDSYWIYKYPVTVKQYKKFIEETKDQKQGWGCSGKMPPEPLWGWKDDHPMVNVNWYEAAAYAAWAGAKLPTEAQWEKAARGTDERIYPWGNEWDPKRCVHSDKVWGDCQSTQPVGSCPDGASDYGALDMAGNVWQWCSDWYSDDYYKNSPASNPTGEKNGSVHVVRGGAWPLCKPKCFQTVNRDWCRVPELWSMDAGFRCVVTGSNLQFSARTPPLIPVPVATPAPAIASAPTTGAPPVMPTPAEPAKSGRQQYLYALDSLQCTIFKINLADGKWEVFRDGPANVSMDFDSKGNIYGAGGDISKISPDGKTRKKFLTGLIMGFACVIDSKDNLYFSDYMAKNARTWKLPLDKVTDDMLPITVTYKDKDQEQDPNIKPAGLLTEVHIMKDLRLPYGLSCDAFDNVYLTRLSGDYPTFWKITPEGKVSVGGWGSDWPRKVIINADGSFTALGGSIMKISKSGLRTGMFAPAIDFHHSTSISYDEQGNLWQATPPEKAEKINWTDPNLGRSATDQELQSRIYKYTPDGERSEIARLGRATWFSMVYPKTKYPLTKPTE